MSSQEEILNLTLSTVADTEIVFNKPVKTVTIQNRAADDIYFRVAENAAAFHTIKGGGSFSRNLSRFAHTNCGYLRAGGGTGPAEIIGLLA
jgi:hypothetical protein